MDHGVVEQRDLAWVEREIDSFGLVECGIDELLARQQAVGGECLLVRQQGTAVRPGNAADAAVLGARRRQCERNDHHDRLDVGVGSILVPTRERLAVRLLGAEGSAPTQDVRANQVLGRVEHTRFADHFVDPGADHMCLLVELDAVVRVARLEGLKLVSIVQCALLRDRTDGRDESVTFECVYLSGREHLWHGGPHVFQVVP